MNPVLHAIRFAGIHTDSLGHYLTGLGLLVAVAGKWPDVRSCWRTGQFMLLHREISQEDILSYLSESWHPTPYERWWTRAQKLDTKTKSSLNLWRERNVRPRDDLRVLDAHVVGVGRNKFNPVLGTGGNVGKRDLAKAWKDSVKLLENPSKLEWLRATMTGEATVELPDLASAGTWFVFANKTFNSGQEWYREGRLSPWSFLLAMEGALLLRGSAGRRLGSRPRPYALFPFISEPAQPPTDLEVGLSKGEFWAPLWDHPANLAEVCALFQRGLARIGKGTAKAPHEFAIAAMAAGVDAGVGQFVRYELRQTTSSQVFEAIPRQRLAVVPKQHSEWTQLHKRSDSELLMEVVPWLDRLPYEPNDPKQKGKFIGLRGPIEEGIVRIGERPDEPERWQALLLSLGHAQARIDCNKALRDRCIALGLLHSEWFKRAWPDPTDEVRLARGIASVGSQFSGPEDPVLVNVFGVEVLNRAATTLRSRATRQVTFVQAGRPQRAVWNNGNPLAVFGQLVQRRLIDAQPRALPPLGGTMPCSVALVNRLLLDASGLDLEKLARWVPPLTLIDWSSPARQDRGIHLAHSPAEDGTAVLHSLFRPLFHPRVLKIDGKPLFPERLRPHAALARRLFFLIQHGAFHEAVEIARNTYLAAARPIVLPPSNLRADNERLAAALLVPVMDCDVEQGLTRWLQPGSNKNF